MLWLSIVLATIISLAALAYVLWPILRPGPPPVLVEDDRLTDLLARKDAVLMSIKELEFDYHMGKISDEDFEHFDERLRRQAIGLLQQIEKVAPESASLDEQLEREIARLRKTQDRPPVPETVTETATETGAKPAADTPQRRPAKAAKPAAPASTGVEAAAEASQALRYCTNCGEALDPAHKFCGHCGAPRPQSEDSPPASQQRPRLLDKRQETPSAP